MRISVLVVNTIEAVDWVQMADHIQSKGCSHQHRILLTNHVSSAAITSASGTLYQPDVEAMSHSLQRVVLYNHVSVPSRHLAFD